MSPSLAELFGSAELVVLLYAVLLIRMLIRRPGKPLAGDSLALFLVNLAILLLLLTGKQFIIYWVPFTILFSATLLRDHSDISGKNEATPGLGRRLLRVTFCLILLTFFGWRTSRHIIDITNQENQFGIHNGVEAAARKLDRTAAPGDVVFNTRWSHFPRLFLYAPRQYCLLGLNPLYMKLHGDRFLDHWLNIRQGVVADPYPFIRGIFRSSYVLAGTGQEELLRRLAQDPRFRQIYRRRSVLLYRLEDKETGFITSWLIAPWTRNKKNREDTATDRAENHTASSGHPPQSENSIWIPYPAVPAPGGIPVGHVNFRPLFATSGSVPAAGMAKTRIHVEDAVPQAKISFGSSGPSAVELDGIKVIQEAAYRELALIDQYSVIVSIDKGEHELGVFSTRTMGDWGFFLRLTDLEGCPLRGVQVVADYQDQ